jgi:hypothetical protein
VVRRSKQCVLQGSRPHLGGGVSEVGHQADRQLALEVLPPCQCLATPAEQAEHAAEHPVCLPPGGLQQPPVGLRLGMRSLVASLAVVGGARVHARDKLR